MRCATPGEFLRGLKDAHVAGCGKHFPGLGEGNLDSHLSLPVVHKSWKALWEQDLLPYRVLAAQLPFVMVAHCAYPEVTGDALPASISKKWIAGVLRKKIGYKGLVVSDDLEMGGVLNVTGIEEAAVGTVQAGADMYLVCHNQELVHRAYEAILKEAERSTPLPHQGRDGGAKNSGGQAALAGADRADAAASQPGNGKPAGSDRMGIQRRTPPHDECEMTQRSLATHTPEP